MSDHQSNILNLHVVNHSITVEIKRITCNFNTFTHAHKRLQTRMYNGWSQDAKLNIEAGTQLELYLLSEDENSGHRGRMQSHYSTQPPNADVVSVLYPRLYTQVFAGCNNA